MSDKVKVACIQFECGIMAASDNEQVKRNIETADRLTRKAKENGANIILLSELFERKYFCQERNYDYYELGEMGYYWITVPRNEQMRASSQSGFLGLVLHLVPGAIHYGYGLVDDGFSIRPVLER